MRPGATYESALAEFLRHLEDQRRVSPETLRAYRRDLLQFAGFL
ncbi:MAG: site-specific integrase, partial [Acidobacteriota bacterium]|nr:site-specific integrase [Acidobacteriota bacterium]